MLHKHLFKTQKDKLLVNKLLLDELCPKMTSYTSFLHRCSCSLVPFVAELEAVG